MTRTTTLLLMLAVSLFWGCPKHEGTESAPATIEIPTEKGETPTDTEKNSSTSEPAPNGDESIATKTGEAVGGAVHTAGEATAKGVKTGVGAVVKGAKAVGKASADAAKGAVAGVKGEK